MKRATALRTANTIAERIKSANGIIGVPWARREFFRIKRAWLFGSTAKGSDSPNDVDILIEGKGCGRLQLTGKTGKRGIAANANARLDRRYSRAYGIPIPVCERDQALRRIRGTLKMVRFHDIDVDGDLAYPRVMIYPRNMLESITSTAKEKA